MKKALFVPGDLGACGYYRMLQFQRLMQMSYGEVLPMYLGPLNLVNAHQDVTVVQRIVSRESLKFLVEHRKETGSKVIMDYDDLLWLPKNGSLHKYNCFLNRLPTEEAAKALAELLDDAADLVTVSCDALKAEVERFVPSDKVKVIPNYLTLNDWWFDQTKEIPNDDTFFYAGSLSHYDNEKKLHGDFSIPLANYLKDKMTMFMGDQPPWFFEKCVMQIPWVSISTYSKALYNNTRYAKFTMAPIESNVFNTCKSDLKYLESCAIGRVCLVSDFTGSPYENAHPMQKIPQNASIGQIKDIVEDCKKHYGEILDYQYNYLNTRWTDSHVDEYANMILEVANG